MWVIAEDRLSGGGALGPDNPVVAPLASPRPTLRAKSTVDKPQQFLGCVESGPGNRRFVLGVGWKQRSQFGRLVFEFFSDRAERHAGEERGGEKKGEPLTDGQAIFGLPRLGFVAEEAEFHGKLFEEACDITVDAFAVGGQPLNMLFR